MGVSFIKFFSIVPEKIPISRVNVITNIFRVLDQFQGELGILARFALIRTTLPTCNRTQLFQLADFHPNLSLVPSESALVLLRSIFEQLRYVPMLFPSVIWRIYEISCMTTFVSL